MLKKRRLIAIDRLNFCQCGSRMIRNECPNLACPLSSEQENKPVSEWQIDALVETIKKNKKPRFTNPKKYT